MHIIILGGGPAGYKAALYADKAGHQVTLIEKEALGGTCLNWGCIPTKAYYKSAEVAKTLQDAALFGFKLEGYALEWDQVQQRKNEVQKELAEGLKKAFKASKVHLVEGTGHFLDAHTLQVETHGGSMQIQGDIILIATGSKEKMIPIPGLAQYSITPKAMMQMNQLPKQMVIIGGGVIGMEFASIFSALGVKITVIEVQDQILSQMDKGTVKRATLAFKKKGIQIITKAKVTQITKSDEQITVIYEMGQEQYPIVCDHVLNAVGRVPVVENLGLEAAGVICHPQGIPTDAYFRTNQSHIYAIGDVTGVNMLAHQAYFAAHAVIQWINNQQPFHQPVIPGCVFTLPEIAEVGYNEESATKAEMAYKVYTNRYGSNGKALALGEKEGLVKIIVDASEVVIGATIMGVGASILIHECALAIENKMTVAQIQSTIHAHPTLSELIVDSFH